LNEFRFAQVAGCVVLAVGVVLAGCGGGSSSGSGGGGTGPVIPANSSTVDFGVTNQTIRGFGGSSAWISNFSAAQAQSLFGTGTGQIGLSILRVRIDPGGSANWGTELNNAQRASALGASVMATPWTPPAAMKSNNSVVGGTLNVASYGDYANYLESFVTYMQTGGVNLYAISVQNEPDAVVNYESCTWDGNQMDAWVASSAGVLTTKLMMPESESFTTGLSDPALNDAAAVDKIAIVAGHTYGTSPVAYPNAAAKGKELWMTEHYFNETGITGAMELAKEVHDGMTGADYNAYLWWWINNWTGGGYLHGLLDESGNVTTNGFALGQFAKFVRPGYVRVGATANPVTGVYVSAYQGNGHHVIVALNLGSAAVTQGFVVKNATVTSVTPYRTSATEGLAQQGAVGVTGGVYSYSLPGQSVTTFVD